MADDEDVWVDSIETYSKQIEIQKAPEPSQRKMFREKSQFIKILTKFLRNFSIQISEREK